jgi:DegV family protein with EDD domain
METPFINGKYLYYAFVSGGNRILQNQAELNRINVFPVNDKDTGTNLASTVRFVMDNIKPSRSFKETLNNISEAALMGARGNSGVIFAQFLHGLSRETENKQSVSFSEFADSIKKTIPYVYQSISNPVEGTMITVIKEWSEFINSKKETVRDYEQVMLDSLSVLKKSLSETTQKLKALNKTGFVDAGAKGFVLFINGVIEFMKNRNIRSLVVPSGEAISLVHSEEITDEVIEHRFCTEAVIKNLKKSKEELRQLLSQNGDSIVVAGSETICRIHVHTNHPAELFYQLKNMGTISFQKVDDMVRQQEVATNRKWNIALVTDSTCDLSQELLEHYQVHTVPINLNFGENHFLDKVTIQPDQFYKMLQTSEDFPKTSQINEQAFTNLYSHLAGYYDAIIAINISSHFSGTYSGSVKAAQRIEKEFNKPVRVIDSKILSGGLGLLVLKAAKLIEEGHKLDYIVDAIENDVKQTKIFVAVRDIKNLIRSGRVSKPKGFVANLLGLNPVISVDENGKSQMFGKTFSQKSSLNKIYNHVEKIGKGKRVWNYTVLHAHNPNLATEIENKLKEMFQKEPLSVVDISPAIGMHAGIGSVAISVMFEN